MPPNFLDASFAYQNILSAFTLGVSLGLFALGMYVLIREQGSQISIVFFVLTFGMTVWLFGFSQMYIAREEGAAWWWARFGYIGVAFIPASVYHFTMLIMLEYERVRKIVLAAWMISFCFAILVLLTDVQFHSVHRFAWGWYPRSGLAAVPFIAFFFVLASASLYTFWAADRSAERGTVQSLRARSLLVTTAAGLASSTDFLTSFGIVVYPVGFIAILLFIVLSFRSMIRYRFIAITPTYASRLIIDTMHDALIVLDPDGVVNVVNEAAMILLGYPEKDLLKKRLTAGMIRDTAFAARLEAVIRAGPVSMREVESLSQDGQVRTLLISTSIMNNRYREPIATVCVLSDITDRKHAETERESLIARLQDALSSVKQLSGMLPICASCKKIRDDKGYWNQIESYIREHSEAEFTHGLCPECGQKLLDELGDQDKK